MNNQGQFIVIEGLEGAGKSTAIKFIRKHLEQRGISLMTTREPGGTDVGEIIRKMVKEQNMDARCELLLFYAARIQLVETVIKPALEKGQWVIGDRFELSTFAYQGGGRGLNRDMIQKISQFSLNGFQPDLIFFLDVPPSLGLTRVHLRGLADRIEQQALSFFEKIYDEYHLVIKSMTNVVVIDASQPLNTIKSIIKQTLDDHYHEY